MATPKQEPKLSLAELIAKGKASRKRLDAVIKEMKALEQQVEAARKAAARTIRKPK